MKKLCVRRYRLASHKLKQGQKTTLVFLTDGHNKYLGEEGERLLQAVESCAPDFVLAGGDMVIGGENDPIEPAVDFMRELSRRYPVCYANGNHEQRLAQFPEKYGDKAARLEEAIAKTDIIRLVNRRADVMAGNVPLAVLGFDPPPEFYHRPHRDDMQAQLSRVFTAPDPEKFTVLLAHHPRYCRDYLAWGADVTLCGHYHGGVVRYGKHHGMVTPDYHIFSPYCCGQYREGSANVIVSAGAGDHTIPFRINNPREVTCLEIVPE